MKALSLTLILFASSQTHAEELLRCSVKTGRMKAALVLPSEGKPSFKITDDKGAAHNCTLKPGFVDHSPQGVVPGFLLALAIESCQPALTAKAKDHVDWDLRLAGRWRQGDALETRLQWIKSQDPGTCTGQPASRAKLDAYLKNLAAARPGTK